MDTRATPVDLIMNEIGPGTPGMAAVIQDEDGLWSMLLDNEAEVHLAWRAEPPRLELLSDAGAVPKDGTVAALRALLMFNVLSGDTAGARVGIDADDRVYLIRDLPQASLDLYSVQSAVRGLVNAAATWREFLERSASQSGPPPQSAAILALYA